MSDYRPSLDQLAQKYGGRLSENVEVRPNPPRNLMNGMAIQRGIAESVLRNYEPNPDFTPADIEAYLRRTDPNQPTPFTNPYQPEPLFPMEHTVNMKPIPAVTRGMYPNIRRGTNR